MPDLSREGVNRFWFQYRDPMIYKIILFMESVETWVPKNHPDFEAAVLKLSEELEHIGNIELKGEELFIKVCSGLNSGRSLRLLQILDIANSGAASELLSYAEENTKNEKDLYAIFVRRNMVFERLRLMSRIFSKQRIDMILRAVENDEE